MALTGLTVRHYRNLARLDLTLPGRGVVVLGDNGQGKTNLLEAIYYLVLFRSFRGAKDRELVRFGEDGFFIAGELGQGEQDEGRGPRAGRLTAGYDSRRRKKKVTVDGAEVERLADAVGHFHAVVFSPADRALVHGGPGERRRYLDVLLSLSRPGYLARLSAMRAALRQRNAALRGGQAAAAWAFDAPLAGAAAVVAAERQAWVDAWRERFAARCRDLGERGTPDMVYAPRRGTATDAEAQREALVAHRERDLRRATTTVGPHRDELALTLDGHATRHFGSAGQQRTAAVALRLLEAETLRQAAGSPPLALFDDVFAELDADRQARLLGLIEETLPGQAILTAPRESEVPDALSDRPRWRITGGVIAES